MYLVTPMFSIDFRAEKTSSRIFRITFMVWFKWGNLDDWRDDWEITKKFHAIVKE